MMNELFNLVMNAKMGTICNVVTLTDAKLSKVCPFFGRVQKLVTQNAQIGYRYANGVNNRLEKIGEERTFVPKPRRWGVWVKGAERKMLEHKGNYYAILYAIENSNIDTKYLVDGEYVSKEFANEYIIPFEKGNTYSNRQSECGLHTHQVVEMDYRFDSIISFAIDGARVVNNSIQYANCIAYNV